MKQVRSGHLITLLSIALLPWLFNCELNAQNGEISGDGTINKCETKTYTITIQNNSGNPLTELVVANNISLLTGFSYVPGSSSLWIDSDPAFCSADPTGTTTLTWDIDTLCGSPQSLLDGETLSIAFQLQTDCTAVSASMNVDFDYLISGTPSSDSAAKSIQVLPGAVTIKKTPNVVAREVGQDVTWTLTVENTGLGTIENVVVSDVLGSGLAYVSSTQNGVNVGQNTTWDAAAYPALASMDPGDILTMDITATVIACSGLDNSADVRWGCDAVSECFNTADDGGTATASVERIVKTPLIDFTPPDITFTYCQDYVDVSFDIVNIGDGAAYNLRSIVDFTGFTVSNVSAGASWDGSQFNLSDPLPPLSAAPDNRYTLSFRLNYTAWCGADFPDRDLLWQKHYQDGCGQDFYPPVELSAITPPSGTVALTVDKSGAGSVIQIGDLVSYTVSSTYSGPLSCGSGSTGAINVVDTIPDGFVVIDADGGVYTPGSGGTGGTVIWTYIPPASLSKTLILQSPPRTECETYCNTTFSNSVTAGGTDCCGCALSASASETSAIECEEGVDSTKTASPAPGVRCTDITYTNTYTFNGDSIVTLNNLVFTEHAENAQTYNGNLSITLDGSDITGSALVTDTTPGGSLVLDFSGASTMSVAGHTLVISYDLTINEATAAACAQTAFYSWSSLSMGATGGQCLGDGIIHETTPVTIVPPAMSLTMSGLGEIIDKCRTQEITLTLTQTSSTVSPKDVRLVLSGLNYYVVDATNPAAITCLGDVIPLSCLPTIDGNGDYIWNFEDGFTGSGQQAVIQLTMQKRCSGLGNLDATASFDDLCHDDAVSDGSCTVSASETPALLLSGDLIIEKTPEVYYGTSNTAQWTIYVTNRGTGTAYNVWVDDLLGAGLHYSSAVVDDMTGVTVSGNLDHAGTVINGATIAISDMTAGERRAITFVADIVDCNNLTNDVSTSWGCIGQNCQVAVADSATVEIPAPMLVHTNVVTNPVDACSAPEGSIIVRNAGQTTCYNVELTETLPTGLVYVSGSTRWRVNGGAWNGPHMDYDPDSINSPLRWTKAEIPALAALVSGDTVELDFDFTAQCPFQGGLVTISTAYENPCGQVFTVADSNFNVSFHAPNVTITKTRSNTPIDCGQDIAWTIAVTNNSGYTLPILWVEDSLDAAYTYVSSTGEPPYTSDDGTYNGVNAVAWELRNVPHNTTVTLTLTAHTDSSPCSPDLDNTVQAWWGCGSADGSSATKPGVDAPDNTLCLGSVSVSDVRTETRQPTVGYLSVALNPLSIDSCNQSTEMTLVIENTGATDASDLDLVITLPAGLSYIAGSSSLYQGADNSGATAPVGDPAIVGNMLTFFDINSKASDLVDVLEASGGNDTIVLKFSVQSNCYTTQDVGLDLRYYDCCGLTQYSTSTNQEVASNYPVLSVTKTPATASVDCGNAVTWTVVVSNTGTGNAQVVRVEDTLGAWLSFVPGSFTSPDKPGTAIVNTSGNVWAWEFNDLAAGNSATFTLQSNLSPVGSPNQADCTTALRQNNVRAIWGCGIAGEATDNNPSTTGYDCSNGTWASAAATTVLMPDLIATDITPSISCSSDGSFSGAISVTVRNQGTGATHGTGFTVSASDGSWTGSGTYSGTLAAGASTTVSIDIGAWTPSCSPCSYNFTATVDTLGEVCECNESNNGYVRPTAYSPAIPDIEVASEALNITCSSDGNYQVSGTVILRNAGCSGTLTSNVPMRFTLHSGTGCSGSQIDQWTQTFTGVSIAAGASQTFALTARSISGNAVSSATSCQFSILSEADYNGDICECDGSDNSLCSDETFTIADLRVVSDTLTITCNADGQVRVSGNVVVANDGCGAAFTSNIPVRVRIYNDDDACSGSNGSFTLTFNSVNIAAGGGTQTFTINSTLNRNLCINSTACLVSVGLELDYSNTLCESDGGNNSYCSPGKIVSIPDLTVYGESLSVACQADGQIRVSGDVTLQNSGCNADVTGNVAVRFTLFSAASCSGSQLDQWTETFSGASIGAGATQTFTLTNHDITTNIVSNSTACQVSLRIEVDPGLAICECNGGNNTLCSNAKTIGAPDLRISAVSPSVSCSSDGSLTGTVAVTVSNNGCGTALDIPVRLESDCAYSFSDQTVTSLAAGASTTLYFSFTPDRDECSCIFTATADPDALVCESDGGNNSLASSSHTSAIADLTVSDIDFSNLACSGDTMSGNVRVTIENIGCDSAANFQVSLSSDGCLGFTPLTVSSLDSGASTTLVFNVTGAWADCSDAACDFTATVDSGSDVCEYDGGNNQRSETFTSTLPDLEVSDIDFTNLSCSGDNISGLVRVTVRNRGFGSATGFTVGLVSDGCLNFTEQTVSATLTNGQTTTVDFAVSGAWADCTDCSCDFTATVDVDNDVCECSGSNNTRTETYANPLPDLQVNSVTPSITCTADGSLTGTVQVNVGNIGCATATSAVVRLSSDCGQTFTDQTVTLAAGANSTLTFNFTPTATTCSCTYTAVIDPDAAICECSGSNNSASSSTLDSTIPDLTISDIDFSNLSCSGDAISGNVQVTVQNVGCDTASNFAVSLASDGCLTFSDQTVTTLAAGSSTTLTFAVSGAWADCTDGACDFTATVDVDNDVCEFSSANNTLVETYNSPLPDLDVSDIDFSNLSCSGDTISGFVRVTVRNRGFGSATGFDVRLASDGCLSFTEQTVSATLTNGQTTTVDFAVSGTWADCTDCSCDFTATVDVDNEVCECSGGNNTRTETYTNPLPDLTVTAVATEIECLGDGNLTGTTVTVQNRGCGDAANVVVRLNSDCGLTFTDQTVNLNAGETKTVFFGFTSGITGCACSFTATIDPDNLICECDGTNNSDSGTLALSIPDLEVQAETLAIGCADDGQFTVGGTVTLQNNGCGPSLTSDVPMRFTLYAGTGCSGSVLTTWTQTLGAVNLASAGGTQSFTIDTQTFPVNLCNVAGDCDLSIRIEADYDDSICEWDGTDNDLCVDKTHDCIDIEAVELVPSVLCRGDGSLTSTLTLTLRNSGGNPLTRDFAIRFSDDRGWEAERFYQADLGGTLPLAAGESVELTQNWDRRFGLDTCRFTDISVFIDSQNEYCQCSSANDVLNVTYDLTFPNLKVMDIQPTCQADGTYRVRVRLQNDGCGDAGSFNLLLSDNAGVKRTLTQSGLARGGDVWVDFDSWPIECEPIMLVFTASVDTDSTVCEFDNGDNLFSVTHNRLEPDLVLLGVSGLCSGDGTISFSGRVVNQGSGSLSPVTLYLYNDADRLLHSLTLPGNSGKESDFSFFIADPAPGQTQTFRLVTDAEFSQCECNGQNNEAQVTIRCEEGDKPLLSLSKTCPSGQAVGGVYRFELEVVNEAGSDLEGLVLRDTLPLGFTYVAGSSRLDGRPITDPTNVTELVWELGTLPQGARRTLVFAAVAAADIDPGQYCNQARVSASRPGETLVLTSNLAECCTVVVGEPDPGCCLDLKVEPLGAWRIPPLPLVKPTYRFETAPAMLTVFGSLDLWKHEPPTPDSYNWLVQQRLREYALTTMREYYLRSASGLLDEQGTLRLSFAASDPIPRGNEDLRWSQTTASQVCTPGQIGRELLALDQAIGAEGDADLRKDLEKLFEHRLLFLTMAGDDLPMNWTLRTNREIRQEGKASLHDRAELYWALNGLSRRSPLTEGLLSRYRLALKDLDQPKIDKEQLGAELFFGLALEQKGENSLLMEKRLKLLDLFNQDRLAFKEARQLALAAALFAKDDAATTRRLMEEIKNRFFNTRYQLVGSPEADGALRVVLEDLGALLLAVNRLEPALRDEWTGIIDGHVSGGILFARPENTISLRVMGDESHPLPLPHRDESSLKPVRPAPVYVRDALILPPEYEPLPLADLTGPWLNILPAEAQVSSGGLAQNASQLMWTGHQLTLSPDPLDRENGRNWRFLGHRFLETILTAASGYQSSSGLFVPEPNMARMGRGEQLLAPDSQALYHLDDLAALALAERAYLQTEGRDKTRMETLLKAQEALIGDLVKAGFVPHTFVMDAEGLPRSKGKSPARGIDLARLSEAFPNLRAILTTLIEKGADSPLGRDDLLFLFQYRPWTALFTKALEKVQETKGKAVDLLLNKDASALLLGQKTRYQEDWWNLTQNLPLAEGASLHGPSDRPFYQLGSLFLGSRLLSEPILQPRLTQVQTLLRDMLRQNWHLPLAGEVQQLPSDRYFVEQPATRTTAFPGDRFVFRVTVDTLCLDGRPGTDTSGTYFIRGRFDRFLDDQGHTGDAGLSRIGDFRWRHDGLAPDGRFSYLGFARIPTQAPFGILGGEFHLSRSNLGDDLWFDWSRDEHCEDLERQGLLQIIPEQQRVGVVFADQNGNGQRDVGEPGISGVRIRDDLGRKVYSDADGRFTFTMGDQPRYLQVMPDSVAAEYLIDPRCSRWIEPRESVETAMPLIPQQPVIGTVYEDQNENGIRDESEPALVDVAVEAGSKRSFSDRDGRFKLINTPVQWRLSLKISDEQPLFKGSIKQVKIEIEKEEK